MMTQFVIFFMCFAAVEAQTKVALCDVGMIFKNHPEFSQKLAGLKQEADAKVAVIQESINKAHGDAKKKLEKKSKEIKKDYDRRISHLEKAWESIKAALT